MAGATTLAPGTGEEMQQELVPGKRTKRPSQGNAGMGTFSARWDGGLVLAREGTLGFGGCAGAAG